MGGWLDGLRALNPFRHKPKDIELPQEGPADPVLMEHRIKSMLESAASPFLKTGQAVEGLRRALGQ